MSISMTIRLAIKNILGNKLRSGLTMLGLVIGISSVILLVGIVAGATKSITDEVSGMGADMLTVYVYNEEKAPTYDEVIELGQIEHVIGSTPSSMLDAKITKGGRPANNVQLIGGGEDYAKNLNIQLAAGRDISRIDVQNYTKCVVIGANIKDTYWKSSNPIGDTIKVNGDNYTVVGVLASAGSIDGFRVDNMVIMPITDARYLGTSSSMSQIYVRATSETDVEDAAKSLKSYLRKTKSLTNDEFEVSSQKQMIESMKEIYRTMSLLLGGIASISLLVGGIGVMNVMLVSVTERTREVGIRKSLGATRKDILFQFLIESVVLSLFGGLLGVVLGLIGGRIAILVGANFAPGITTILLAVGVSIFVGILFGILPAYRAACMKPVDALRYE